MEKTITHPIEIYSAYILIAVALTFYLSRTKGDVDSIKPGSSFTIMIPFKILAALVSFGMPGILISALPEAVHPRSATAMTIVITILFTIAYFALVSTRLEITEHGVVFKCLGWKQQYRFDEFKGVTVFRYNIVLERKIPSGMNPAFPAFFSNIAGLNTYLKSKIEGTAEGVRTAEGSRE